MTVIVDTLIGLYTRSPLITNIFINYLLRMSFALTFSFYLEEIVYYCLVKNDGFQRRIIA